MTRGPLPKHPGVRQRTNKTSTAATLPVLPAEDRAAIDVPELPAGRLWDPRTSEWWADAWQSPMRLEWDPVDTHALVQTAYLLDEFYKEADADEPDYRKLVSLSKGVMDRGVRMGVDPFARRSLQWVLAQTEATEAGTENTKARTAATRAKSADGKQKRGGFDSLT